MKKLVFRFNELAILLAECICTNIDGIKAANLVLVDFHTRFCDDILSYK